MFERSDIRVETPALSIVPDGRIAVNTAACRILTRARVKAVLLLWDKANQKVAIKAASRNDKNAYAVSITGNHSGSIRAKAFVAHIGWNAQRQMIPATWNEKDRMFEASIPRHFLTPPAAGAQKGHGEKVSR